MTSRDTVLTRIRNALGTTPHSPAPATTYAARDYLTVHADRTPYETADLLAENLTDYRAKVHRTDEAGLAPTVARLLAERGSRTAVVPSGVPVEWLAGIGGTRLLDDAPALTAGQLDEVDSVITGCALAIAETGTIVLDASPDQGRRILTLVPDHHICVVRAPDQVVASVPHALPRLDPTRPQTWISGPSATSDIELDRVEGVHGPRTLDVILVGPPPSG
ncbi:lactate utilization protein C [Streptomyces sp. CBMA29]|uniref:LutC/YkgG family protein n=1 Tax=Streptomyces sp. CBMA29 TaxID=1896314 RepID=UPI001661FE40|nr:LUD domain-containing protein [Streptomyces sp. CBMA29]MBD0738935.1 lactate utilization protein B/C [Streptomyces sp. CBMA29]